MLTINSMDNSLNERLFWFISIRVGKKPFFFKKTQPSGFFWFFLGFVCFFV